MLAVHRLILSLMAVARVLLLDKDPVVPERISRLLTLMLVTAVPPPDPEETVIVAVYPAKFEVPVDWTLNPSFFTDVQGDAMLG